MANLELETGEASGAISVIKAVAPLERGHPGRTTILGPIGNMIIDVGSDRKGDVVQAVVVDNVELGTYSTTTGGEVRGMMGVVIMVVH